MNQNSETRGFTMLYDELGLSPAAVLCVALRFCKLSDGVCRASVSRIGERVGWCKGTVHKALKRLVVRHTWRT